jgi:peptidoglycan/xylan/chitin deacetylase (PgdA/CDA1 family)
MLILNKNEKVCLTFDDGPNENTAEILDLLKRYGIKSSFFWITENAEKLRRRDKDIFDLTLAKAKDHTIGYHGPYDYVPNMKHRLTSKYSFEEFKKGLVELESLVCRKIHFYRPHCFMQPISVIYAHRLGLETVLGSITAYAKPGIEEDKQIKQFSRAVEGSIIIFHEGETMLRKVPTTLDVVEQTILNLRNDGLDFDKL